MYIHAIMIYMIRLVAIGEASQVLGVSIATLRRWEAAGKLIPERTVAGHRRYDLASMPAAATSAMMPSTSSRPISRAGSTPSALRI